MIWDTIVIGGGAIGIAATDALARRGAKVLCLDRSSIPNTESSHHGESRIIRLAYFEHPDYVPLLRRAYEGWADLSPEVLVPTGILYAGPEESEVIQGCLASATEHGLQLERWTHTLLKSRYPQFALPPEYTVLWEPTGGLLRPELAIQIFRERAERQGATIHENEAVTSWTGTKVTTASADYEARAVVLASGAWLPQFRPDLPLTVTAQSAHWFDCGPGYGPGDFPIFGIQSDTGSFVYGFPDMGTGLKVALHDIGPTLDSPKPPEAVCDVRFALPYLGLTDQAPRRSSACMYTNSPDGQFVLGREGNVVLASCCSGHGFKFAPALGEAIADLALTGATELPVGFLSPTRF